MVFVSHSAKIAEGLVDLARQMAPAVSLVAAGGTDEGGIGTSFEKVSTGVLEADTGQGVVVLCDLGSAILTAETALEFLDDVVRDRVLVVDAPLVEGGVAAAVAAQMGSELRAVAEAARSAFGTAPEGAPGAGVGDGAAATDEGEPAADEVTRSVVLRNRDGLHARPAAEFVKLASTFDAQVRVNGRDAKSLLGIMGLGLTAGATVEISSRGPEAEAAVSALSGLVESGFGE